METIATLVKIMASDFVLLIMAYFAQDQADRYSGKIARFFQRALTVLLMLSMIVCAGSVIAVIWVNN